MPMHFQEAVARTEGLKGAYRAGLQALSPGDQQRIRCDDPRRVLTGSVSLDQCLMSSHADEPRWDYGIGMRKARDPDHVLWVEVHPATSHGVQEVCKKHEWLLNWLKSSAPLLDKMNRTCIWVASGRVDIPQNSPHRRPLAKRGIQFAGRILRL